MEAAEPDRRRHHQPAARPGALALDRVFGFLDIGKDASRPLQIAGADIGQAHRACGPLQQPRAEALFQRRDQPGDARGRQPELAGGRRKALQVRNRDKGLHRVETVHDIISYNAIMKCQSR